MADLEIDLNAIAANWRFLDGLHPGATGAAVKADAYGLGAAQVASALRAAGCKHFFVAHLAEAVALSPLLPGTILAVLHGIQPGEVPDFVAHGPLPVLSSLGDIERWGEAARRRGEKLPAMLHADTGMNRLGLSRAELARLADNLSLLEGIDLRFVMSHLVSAEVPGAAINALQLERFLQLRQLFPNARASLANSSGIFLGPAFQTDLARPGAALYGLNPLAGQPNPMRPVIRLTAPILSVRDLAAGETVGYNAIWTARRPSRIATIAAGYADGILRSLSSAASARFDGMPIPLVGRVSMDLATFDVTDHPAATPGQTLEVIGAGHDADALALEAGTNGYEILTSLGQRYRRLYFGGPHSR